MYHFPIIKFAHATSSNSPLLPTSTMSAFRRRFHLFWGRICLYRMQTKTCLCFRLRDVGPVFQIFDLFCRLFPCFLLSALIILLFIAKYPEHQLRNIQFIVTAKRPLTAVSPTKPIFTGRPSSDPGNFSWHSPPSFHDGYAIRRNTMFSTRQRKHSWLQPLVFFTHARRINASSPATELFLYMTGVSMGTFRRNFSIVGCLVQKDVYPVVFNERDVAMCTLDRQVLPGELLSVALLKDDTLNLALKGPVELKPGVEVTLAQGDVYPAPKETILHHLPNDIQINDIMLVRSVVTANPISMPKEEMSRSPRYEVCMATQMKPYPYLLPDWIDYHRRIGVDMIYILDNNSPEDISDKFVDRNDVEVLYWPWKCSQIQAWSWLLVAARSRCEWILLSDADEYVMFGIGKNQEHASKQPLRYFAKRMQTEGYRQAFLQFIVMGNSGYTSRPKEPLPEAFIHFKHYNSTNGKVLLSTDAEWMMSTVHWGRGKTGMKTYWEKDASIYPTEMKDVPRIVHYQFRSWEDYLLKMRTGSGSTYDKVVVEDLSTKGKKPGGYLNTLPQDEYTHFRHIWRAVMNEEWNGGQRMVRRQGNGRCRVQVMAGEFGEESCEGVEIGKGSTREETKTTVPSSRTIH